MGLPDSIDSFIRAAYQCGAAETLAIPLVVIALLYALSFLGQRRKR